MLDHLLISQFHRDFLISWDTTVTQKPVDAFPNAITCARKRLLTWVRIIAFLCKIDHFCLTYHGLNTFLL